MKALVLERSLPRYAVSTAASRLFGSGRGVHHGPLRLRTTPQPELPGPGWCRLTPILAGICGSDLATLDGRSSWYFENFVSLPCVPGHEIVGLLEGSRERGAGKRGAGAEGAGERRVVVESVLGCATRGVAPQCKYCEHGLQQLCEHTAFGNLEPGLQTGYCASTGGGWSTSLVVHESQCHDIPDEMSDEAAVMVEPTACAVHAVLAGGLAAGELAVVSGAGALGLCVVAAIKHLAPRTRVLVAAKYAHQRQLAKNLGADLVVTPEAIGRATRRLTESLALGRHLSNGADAVFDCVGSAQTLAGALEVVRPRGRIVLVGMPGAVKVDLAPLWHREIRLLGAYAYGAEDPRSPGASVDPGARNNAAGDPAARVSTFDLAIEVVATASLESLVSATYPLERYEDAIRHAATAGMRGSTKIAFDMRTVAAHTSTQSIQSIAGASASASASIQGSHGNVGSRHQRFSHNESRNRGELHT